jgi:ribonuclease-3
MKSTSNQKDPHPTDPHGALVEECEDILNYYFQNKNLLLEAITHASFTDNRVNSYERLEFLGDSILGFAVCDYLFHRFPNWLEGELTKVKSNVVSRQTCAKIGFAMGIDRILVVGKGVGSLGKVPSSLVANAFESIVGAIYLDGGIEAVRHFLLPLIEDHVAAAVAGRLDTNYKSELQQYSQKRFNVPPNYRVVDSRGPDHEKEFLVSAIVHKQTFEPAWGSNKKEAEQRAAANALAELDGQEPPYNISSD